ncbi:MAG: hypothetical protein M3R38_07125 [Actinomycetota bacterium]|nr:hypothetical protein [Actinomycetota bacterium]
MTCECSEPDHGRNRAVRANAEVKRLVGECYAAEERYAKAKKARDEMPGAWRKVGSLQNNECIAAAEEIKRTQKALREAYEGAVAAERNLLPLGESQGG